MRRHLIGSSKIAMAYVGTVIGAGFATGQEILQFFTRYGYKSFFATLLSTLLFILVGKKILQLGKSLKVKSFKGLIDHVFGAFAPFVNLYLAVAFVLLSSAMFAGAGALFSEYWGMPFLIGALITSLMTLLIVVKGVKGLLTANMVIVPLIVAFNFLIFLYVSRQNFQPVVDFRIVPNDILPLVRTGITYASFNLILSVGVLAPLGGAARDEKVLWSGSIMGGCLLGLMLLIGNYCLLKYIPEVFHREIPLLFIVKRMGRIAVVSYGLIIWGGILTTAIGNMFSITSILQELLSIKPLIPSIVITMIALVVCNLGFANIVSWFYPLLGIIGFVLIGIMLIQT